jgi:hypothetical protein
MIYELVKETRNKLVKLKNDRGGEYVGNAFKYVF